MIFKSAGQYLVNMLVYTIFMTLHATYRYRFYHFDRRVKAIKHHPRGAFVLVLWHEHVFGSIGAHSFQGISPIVSMSRDGDTAAFLATKLGMEPVRGSSSRGGQEAKSMLEAKVAGGLCGAITIDGPRGPRRQSKSGAIQIAKGTGTMILPSTAIPDRFWTLRSWDKFKIPKPFARIAVTYGEPYTVGEVESKETLRQLAADLTERVNSLDRVAENALADSSVPWTSRRDVKRTYRTMKHDFERAR